MFKRLMEKQKEHNEKVKAKQEKIRTKNDDKRSGTKEVIGNITKYYFRSNGKYEVEINSNLITITNKGAQNFINKGAVGTKTIKIENITGVQFKEWGNLTGYIQFILMGQEVKGGALAAVQDENTITFSTRTEEGWAREIKEYIESYSPNTNNISAADEILKYKNLLDLGAITQEEFDCKKKELLGI